jgi:predicted RNase H-like nuclease
MTRIAGVDGCGAGWIGVIRDLDTARLSSRVVSSIEQFFDAMDDLQIVAIDIPIGLTEGEARSCDIEARQRLRARWRSVFHAPIRPILEIMHHAAANTESRRLSGRGLTMQAHAIFPRVLDVDRALSRQPELRQRVYEIHPELTFWAWNHEKPMAYAKKSPEGHRERRTLIEKYFGESAFDQVRSGYRFKKDVADDDILDAFAALWTAERIWRGESRYLPDRPPLDTSGLPMRMMY